MSTPSAITLREVTKTFRGNNGPVEAVRGLDLDVRPGEVVAFLGPNGAGKTTTIDTILGLAEPTSGTAEVFGLEPRDAVGRGLVSAVMQTGGLLKDLSVRETVAYTANLFAQPRPVDEVLSTAGIENITDRRVGKCSGGEQQRVRFAMALVPDPALLILDEPTTGMDVNARRSFWEAIRADAERGRTILFATHYLEEADDWADRVVMVRDGEVVADGGAAEIRARAGGRRVSFTLPQASDDALAALRALPGVTTLEGTGERFHLVTGDSDATARHLLANTDAHDLQITARGLEDAFVSFTSSQTDARSTESNRTQGATS